MPNLIWNMNKTQVPLESGLNLLKFWSNANGNVFFSWTCFTSQLENVLVSHFSKTCIAGFSSNLNNTKQCLLQGPCRRQTFLNQGPPTRSWGRNFQFYKKIYPGTALVETVEMLALLPWSQLVFIWYSFPFSTCISLANLSRLTENGNILRYLTIPISLSFRSHLKEMFFTHLGRFGDWRTPRWTPGFGPFPPAWFRPLRPSDHAMIG